jgi:hypothetical protein
MNRRSFLACGAFHNPVSPLSAIDMICVTKPARVLVRVVLGQLNGWRLDGRLLAPIEKSQLYD